MSTILKALKQIENDRAASQAEGSGDPESTAGAEAMLPLLRRRRRQPPIWLGVGLLVAGGSLIGVALIPKSDEPPLVVSTPVVEQSPAPARDASAPSFELPPGFKFPPPLEVYGFVPAPDGPDDPSAVGYAASQIEPDVEPPGVAGSDAALLVVRQPIVRKPVAVVEPVTMPDAITTEPVVIAAEAAPRLLPPPPARELPAPVVVARRLPPAPREVAREPVRAAAASESAADATRPAPVVLSNQDLDRTSSPDIERARTLVRAGLEAEVAPEPVVVDAEPVLDAAPLAPPKLEPVVTRAVVPDAAVPVAVARPELAPPQLGLVRTRWHPRPERREALVVVDDAEQMVREGDETLGYAVIEITPSSIVFGREGDTVRVRVGTH